MKLFIVTLRGYDTLGDSIIKVFSDRKTLDKWLDYADKMEMELYGSRRDPAMSISKSYKIREADLDNLDYIELYDNAKQLGAHIKPAPAQ